MKVEIVINKEEEKRTKRFSDIRTGSWFYGCREEGNDRSLWYKTIYGCVGFLAEYGNVFTMPLIDFDEFITQYEEVTERPVKITVEFGNSC